MRAVPWLAIAAVASAGLMGATLQAEAAPVSPRTSSAPSETYAVVKTIGVGVSPRWVAVDDSDDTVYVTNEGSNTVTVIDACSGEATGSINVGDGPRSIGIDELDDTVYVANSGGSSISAIDGRAGSVYKTIPMDVTPYGLVVDQADDTLYVGNGDPNDGPVADRVMALDPRTDDSTVFMQGNYKPWGLALNQGDDLLYMTLTGVDFLQRASLAGLANDLILVGTAPTEVAVDQDDDTAYVVNNGDSSVSVIPSASNTAVATVEVGADANGIAVDNSDDTVYVANAADGNVMVINPATYAVDDTISVGRDPYGLSVDQSGANAGIVYVPNSGDDNVSVIARAAPSLATSTGEVGSTATVNLSIPQLSCGPWVIDDSTVASVSFDGVAATDLTQTGTREWSMTVPAGTGTVPVEVTFNGGLVASAGNFTYTTAPAPVPSETYAAVKTIDTGGRPYGIAVNDTDDTVYVINSATDDLTILDGCTGDPAGTVAVGDQPWAVDVNQGDDTVYVTNFNSRTVSIIDGRHVDDSSTISTAPEYPNGLAVDEADDTIFVGFFNEGKVRAYEGVAPHASSIVYSAPSSGLRGLALDQSDDTLYAVASGAGFNQLVSLRTDGGGTPSLESVGSNPAIVAVNQVDDSVYVTDSSANTVSVIAGPTGSLSGSIRVGVRPWGIAVDQIDDTLYVGNINSDNLSVVDGRSGQLTDDTIAVGDQPWAVAVDQAGTNTGVVYVANYGDDNVSVIARAAPSLGTSTGEVGSTATVNLSIPQLSCGPWVIDDSTVASVSFDGVAATDLTQTGTREWSMTVPAGTGTVPVEVTFNGGLVASAGNFTYTTAPAPVPPVTYPPGAPTDVVAEPADASANVQWSPPAEQGSFPVTDYQVSSVPAGSSCLVAAPTTTCKMGDLVNGVSYTFVVRALSGAGWGLPSNPSNGVTPEAPVRPVITIEGARGDLKGHPGVRVRGVAKDLDADTVQVYLRFPGQRGYTPGAIRPVAADGTFTWQRRTNKRVYVYVTGEDTRSNRLIIRT